MFHHFKNMFTRIKRHLIGGCGIILIINILKKKDKILNVRCDKSNIAMDMELY